VKTIVVDQQLIIPVFDVLSEEQVVVLIRTLRDNRDAWEHAEHLTRVLHERHLLPEAQRVVGREKGGKILVMSNQAFADFERR
jgi:hypothetical protein